MKLSYGILLATLLLAACGPDSNSSKAPLEQQRNTLNKAKEVDALQQQEAKKEQKEMEKQTQ